MIQNREIKELLIKNFKSIKDLKIECKKINLFIGKPNTGKSNILEAVGMFSLPFSSGSLTDLIRLENMYNLFYDNELIEKVHITNITKYNENASYHIELDIVYENGQYTIKANEHKVDQEGFRSLGQHILLFDSIYGENTELIQFATSQQKRIFHKFYKFKVLKEFKNKSGLFLLPPYGENLMNILMTNKPIKNLVSNIFEEYGYSLVLEPHENTIKIQKYIDGVVVSYPYSLSSDTLQRIVFHLAAIQTNTDSIIILEEPEAHSFPYYTKFLAEKITKSDSNQFFITTHNPYFLSAILEKASPKDVNIFITYFENFQTKVKCINENEKQEVIDKGAYIFFDLDKFIPKS
jgi:AAA15 family ATPase/GTPase